MRVHILIILSFFLFSIEAQSSPSRIAKLDERTFSHTDVKHEIQRTVSIKGHTYIENLASYLKEAAVAEKDHVVFDEKIATDLDKVQVITVEKSNIDFYSGATFYIVTTKAGRHFLHFQAVTRKTRYKDPHYEKRSFLITAAKPTR